MWIKICGLTNLKDARLAVSLGADAIGFIFTASKRKVSPEKVREIIAALPPEGEKIGVFVDEEKEKVRKIAEFCGLTGLQFHGSESPEYCRNFINDKYQIIKAFRVDEKRGWDEVIPHVRKKTVNRILLDTFVSGLYGGTGKAFSWNLVPEARKNWGEIPFIMAGGLNPDNVVQAIREGKPWGIDVGSGVEKEPGKKDGEKLKVLISRVRAIDSV
ncbi:MAG: hypothetical protein JM58_18555 [Peptococcaceae bacterium BICA1-8]|nr:MAG: hypothetical protein JM58_18555 [Peptococcaceae bacterium BICA1-8]